MLGVHDEAYPRNERIRRFLESRGCVVKVIRKRRPGHAVSETLRLIRCALQLKDHWDVVICPEFANELFAAAWLIARAKRALFVLDFFVGLHETRVVDRRGPRRRVVRARLIWLADYLTVKAADRLVTDTELRARIFARRYGSAAKWSYLPVGAPDWTTRAASSPAADAVEGTVRLLHYGNYVPLHGIDVALDGVLLASSRRSVQLTVIGDERRRSEVGAWVSGHDLHFPVQVLGSVRPAELAGHIAASHVVLGVFGSSAKARSVIPNKVWQGLACGRTVITTASEAYSDLRPVVGARLVEVDPSAESLAEAIVALDDRLFERDDSLGRALRDHVEDRFSRWYQHELFATCGPC